MVKLSELSKSEQERILKEVDSDMPKGMTKEELEKEEKQGLNFGARYLGIPIKNKKEEKKVQKKTKSKIGMFKGGILNRTYGMKEGGFTKRGGMYKKGYIYSDD